MKQNNVDNFLSHLNQQHPSIRFTMETENDNKIAFLDTLVTRQPDGKLHTSVYRKSTHTDQYLAYDSYHLQSVKRDIVKCLHDRAKRIITKPSGTAQEKKHLSTVLVGNGHPSSFLWRWPTPGIQHQRGKQPDSSPPQCCHTSKEFQKLSAATYNNKEYVPSSNPRSRLVRPKDPADPNKQDGVV